MERNFYITKSPAGPVGCTNSFYEALEVAHKLSAQPASPLFAPSEIECLNTGERFNFNGLRLIAKRPLGAVSALCPHSHCRTRR
jgi:hypothetical protein